MLYQIILFDLDDTLVDFSASEFISLQKIHEQFYQNIEYAMFEDAYKEINGALWKRVGAQENPLMPSDIRFLRFRQLNEQLNLQIPAEEVAEQYESYLGEHVDWLPEVKKAVEFLHQKGHILGVITNGLSDAQKRKRERLGLHQWFDCFVVSDEVGIAKPDQQIFDIALAAIAGKRNQLVHHYHKSSILMVGDSILSDGHGAKNFGINYCHINKNNSVSELCETPITYHINSVAEIPLCIGYKTEYESFLKSSTKI